LKSVKREHKVISSASCGDSTQTLPFLRVAITMSRPTNLISYLC
jgi:hypothetical protein